MPNEPTTKPCFRCGDDKPLDQFYANKGMPDGHVNKCKPCTLSDIRKRRVDHPEEVRAVDRARHLRDGPKRRKAGRERESAKRLDGSWQEALDAAGNRCIRCGSEGSQEGKGNSLVVHHKDRSGHDRGAKAEKPNNDPSNLEVLCRPCHLLEHFEEVRYAGKTDRA